MPVLACVANLGGTAGLRSCCEGDLVTFDDGVENINRKLQDGSHINVTDDTLALCSKNEMYN